MGALAPPLAHNSNDQPIEMSKRAAESSAEGDQTEKKEYYVILKTEKEKRERIVDVLEFIGTTWLQFVKMILAEPSIPFPVMPNNSCLVMVPTSFRWTNPETKTTAGATTTDQYDRVEVRIGEGDWKRMTPEEAFAAIKAVFSQ